MLTYDYYVFCNNLLDIFKQDAQSPIKLKIISIEVKTPSREAFFKSEVHAHL